MYEGVDGNSTESNAFSKNFKTESGPSANSFETEAVAAARALPGCDDVYVKALISTLKKEHKFVFYYINESRKRHSLTLNDFETTFLDEIFLVTNLSFSKNLFLQFTKEL